MSFNGKRINKVGLTDNLPAFLSSVERKAAKSIAQALILGASEASVLTPIDTSTLINSRYHDVRKEGSRIVGSSGYTAEYAAAVNDPANPQKFRRPTAVKDFLKKGFEHAEPNIRAVVIGSIRT